MQEQLATRKASDASAPRYKMTIEKDVDVPMREQTTEPGMNGMRADVVRRKVHQRSVDPKLRPGDHLTEVGHDPSESDAAAGLVV